MKPKEPVTWGWRGALSFVMLYVAIENNAIRKELRTLTDVNTNNAVRLARIERLLLFNEQASTERNYGSKRLN